MVKLTINDQSIEVAEGTTVLGAARQAGIPIPTLCDHPELTPYGGCRLCLVEVEGARTLQPSCTLPASDRMVVHTDTQRVHEARKFVLTLLFSERNHFCPFCQVSGGDCALQNAALDEGMAHWPLQPNYQPFPVDASHPYFILDNNRCILCRRCVRICGELIGNFTLGFEERGSRSLLVADFGVPLGQSTCISCGACIQDCPTGALIDRASAYRGKETHVDHHGSVCVGCSVGCGIDVLTRDNQLVRIEGDWEAPVSNGILCEIGRFLPMVDNEQRVATPLIRKNGALKAATWDEALATIVDKLQPLAGKAGHGIAAMASTRLPAEALSLFKQVFAHGLHSDLVTSSEEGIATAVPTALATELGHGFEGGLSALHDADVILSVGTDLVHDHQVAGFFVKRVLPTGTKLVVLDAVDNTLDIFAEKALKPFTTAYSELIEALCAALTQLGLAKKEYQPSESLSVLAAKAGVSVDDVLATARLVGTAAKPAIVFGKGITAGSSQAMHSLVKFADMIGALSSAGSRIIGLKGDANSLAASLYGLEQPFQLDGHQAVFLALADDTPSKRLIQKLEKAPFLIVAAAYTSQLTAQADVVLPVAKWTEQEGHYVNLEGRIQMAIKSQEAAAEVRTCEEVLRDLAERMQISTGLAWDAALAQRISPIAVSV